MTEAQRYRLLAAAAVVHAALPAAMGWLGLLSRWGEAGMVAAVALWWGWPFLWLVPLWRARYDDTRSWWAALALLGLAAPAMLFVTAILAGGKT